MRVRIHPHRPKVLAGITECISVTPIGGRVYYVGSCVLTDVVFVVHRSGVRRAQESGVRNVHAWAEGELREEPVPLEGFRKVTYHFQEGYFRDLESNEPVENTDVLYAIGRDFWYLP